MSNLKKLESMMKEYSKQKKPSDEERIKDIKILKKHEDDLVKVNLILYLIFLKSFNTIIY